MCIRPERSLQMPQFLHNIWLFLLYSNLFAIHLAALYFFNKTKTTSLLPLLSLIPPSS